MVTSVICKPGKALATLLLCISALTISFSANAAPDKDFIVFKSCIFQTAIGQCTKADFNQDGNINLLDYILLIQVYNFDLTGDSVIDLSSNPTVSDLLAFQACVVDPTGSQCAKADFNSDGVIDALDETLLREALIRFDLDGDLRAEYYFNQAPSFRNTSIKPTGEDQLLSFYIWARDGNGDTVSYTLETMLKDTEYKTIVMGDLNKDGIVDDTDLVEMDSQITNKATITTKSARPFDLNNDKIINSSDADLLKTLVGKTEHALFFTWKPEDNQSGNHEIIANATSYNVYGEPATTQATIKFSVIDRQSIDDYYAYDDVLVVINRNSPVSQTIGQYFIQQREIPARHVVYIDSPAKETINWDVFATTVAAPIRQHLLDNKLETKINYIVTTKGVPLRIYQANFDFGTSTGTLRRSIDSVLTLLTKPLVATSGSSRNPYFNSPYPFSREMYGIYLVTRLTGYTETDAIRLVDNATNTSTSGTFVFDVDPSKDNPGYHFGNDGMREANTSLVNGGWNTFIDETTTYLTGQADVLGYVSWGSNDANDTNNAIPYNTWLPGAIAETFVSTSARTFTAPASYGQSLIADWIAEGVTGIKGYTFEPYLGAMAQPQILFPRYTSGYMLADSYYAASQYINWQDVVVGDPKAAIASNFGKLWKLSGAKQLAENWVLNSSPTYTTDGYGLVLVDAQENSQCPFCYTVALTFTSRNVGYGVREFVLPAITPHTVVVGVERGKVVSAINDYVFDELNNTFITP
jgi:uncharacterized protein (TIGR03790 family)